MESYHHVKEVGQIYYKVKVVHVNLSYYKSQQTCPKNEQLFEKRGINSLSWLN